MKIKYLLIFLIILGCTTSVNNIIIPEVPNGFSEGKYYGYLYASEIDPGVVLKEWTLVREAIDELGLTWEEYENPNKGKPDKIIFIKNEFNIVKIYIYAINGELKSYESYQLEFSFCYKEIEWNAYNFFLRDIFMEVLELNKEGI